MYRVILAPSLIVSMKNITGVEVFITRNRVAAIAKYEAYCRPGASIYPEGFAYVLRSYRGENLIVRMASLKHLNQENKNETD